MFPARRRDRPAGIHRAEWYDRNATHVKQSCWGEGWTPHGSTVRISYTIPTGKKAYMEFLYAKMRRVTAATTAGLAYIVGSVTPSGQAGYDLFEIHTLSNVVGDGDRIALPQSMVLLEGDSFAVFTGDGSTGGAITYIAANKFTEFER